MELFYRKCTATDIDELTCISKRTFIDAFEKDNNPKDFKIYIDQAFTNQKIASELQNPNTTFYLVYADGVLVGYFKLNTDNAQTDLKLPGSMELERIYVLKEYQGMEIGKKMLERAKEISKKMGKSFLWLGVWENNEKAITFYKRHGFSKFGTHPYFIGDDEQTDWLMRFDLINFKVE